MPVSDDGEARVHHAWLLTAGSAALGAFSIVSAIGMMLVRRANIVPPAAIAITLLFAVLHGIAAWSIDRRRAVGGYLALALFLYRIVVAIWRGNLVSFAFVYAVVGIWVVLRAATPLGMRLPTRLQRSRVA